MNLRTKVKKFTNAVWEYRGKYDPITLKWHKLPKYKAKARVIKGLERLGIEVNSGLAVVDSFKNKQDFDKFIALIFEEKEKQE